MSEPQLYVDCSCHVAECPRWSNRERCLYWADIPEGRCYRHWDGTPIGDYESCCPGVGKIGALVICGDGTLQLFAASCRIWKWSFGTKPILAAELQGYETRRFNDVWTDGENCFCGVARDASHPGEFWLWRNGEFACIESALEGMPNGIGVSPDGSKLYLVVSEEKRIYQYDYNRSAGSLRNRCVLCSDFVGDGIPDGMTVDPRDGSLYVAIWGGGRLEKRAPTGECIASVRFPMPLVTSVEIAGSRLFVTTGNKADDFDAAYRDFKAGAVFVASFESGKSNM